MKKTRVARKYAQAFLQYGNLYDRDLLFVLRLDGLVQFLTWYRDLFFHAEKESYMILVRIFGFDEKKFGLFLDLLIHDKRLWLFKDVIKSMSMLYRHHNNIEQCSLASSHQLDQQQRDDICRFLESALGKKIIYSYKVNKSLIAGIRARGNSFIWEHSIARKLRVIEQSY